MCMLNKVIMINLKVARVYPLNETIHIEKDYPYWESLFLSLSLSLYIYIILIARVRVQYGKIFYEHAKYFHEPKASENVAWE